MNASWAGDAKAGKTVFYQIRKRQGEKKKKKLNVLQRKKEMGKVQRKVRTKQDDGVNRVNSEKIKMSVWERLKSREGGNASEERLKWTKRL